MLELFINFNILFFAFMVTFFTSTMDVFNFKIKGFDFGGGWDAWHVTKWLFIAYLVVDKYISEYGCTFINYKDAGLLFMWLVVIIVGLHTLILHYLFKGE